MEACQRPHPVLVDLQMLMSPQQFPRSIRTITGPAFDNDGVRFSFETQVGLAEAELTISQI